MHESMVPNDVAVLSGVVGLYVSYFAGIASGAAIVLVTTVFFGIAWLARAAMGK
jgi:manganese/iron transport system permease protein